MVVEDAEQSLAVFAVGLGVENVLRERWPPLGNAMHNARNFRYSPSARSSASLDPKVGTVTIASIHHDSCSANPSFDVAMGSYHQGTFCCGTPEVGGVQLPSLSQPAEDVSSLFACW